LSTTLHEAEVPWFSFPSLDETGVVRHAFSTRRGGVSPAPFDGLNLGLTTKDDETNVRQNRRRFETATGLSLVDSVGLAHGNQVHYATGAVPTEGLPLADAVVTDVPGVPLTLYYADCCPVFILDPSRRCVGLVHAGWRGTVADVSGATVRSMVEWFGAVPTSCLAGVGSSIGPCCFEVDWDVAGEVLARYPQWEDLVRKLSNKWTVDLWELNARLLERSGIPRHRIAVSRLCTACRPDLFFSFRRDRRNTGRLASTCVLTS
jgi:hypothetical protein